MQTRDSARTDRAIVANGVDVAERRSGGMRQTTLLAVTALVGGLLLIALTAVLIMCWELHPLVMLAVGSALVWLATRLAGKVLSPDARAR
jgi:hypothetical protein